MFKQDWDCKIRNNFGTIILYKFAIPQVYTKNTFSVGNLLSCTVSDKVNHQLNSNSSGT